MTLLVSWIGVDSRGPASLYMISDSRLSWKNGKTTKFWDYGKKVFAFKNTPDIIGYCGDVVFPVQAISHIVDLADNGLLFANIYSEDRRFKRIEFKIKELLKPYPEEYIAHSFSILYGTRVSKSEFACYELNWDKKKGWWSKKNSHVDFSDKIFVLGSGSEEFNLKYKKYQEGINKRTSRAIFHCFCDTIDTITDIQCGGIPQLVGVYRIKNAINYGIFYKNKRYLSGIPVDNLSNFTKIEWRNELFERMDGNRKNLIKHAQKQPNPLR